MFSLITQRSQNFVTPGEIMKTWTIPGIASSASLNSTETTRIISPSWQVPAISTTRIWLEQPNSLYIIMLITVNK